jgi:RecB family exonuclease
LNAPDRIVTTQPLVFIRASSLAEMFDCPARWEAKYIKGLRGPRSAAAQLGTAVHAGTALFDSSRLPGGSPVTADDAASALVDAIHKPEEEVDWDDSNPNDVERIALALHTKYCADIAPKQTYLGVEVKCEKLELPELGIALTGTTDRVRTTPAGNGISDLKTGKSAVGADGRANTQGHGPQLGVYELLAQHAMGIDITAPAQIVGMNTGKTPAAQRVAAGEVPDARAALVGTEESPGLLEHASRLLHSGAFYGNSKSYLCSEKYCPAHATCRFKG